MLTIPKTLRIFSKFRRELLGELCRAAARSLTAYFKALAGEDLVPGIIAAVKTFGDRINFDPHLHLLVTEGGVDQAGRVHRTPRLDDGRLADVGDGSIQKILLDKLDIVYNVYIRYILNIQMKWIIDQEPR